MGDAKVPKGKIRKLKGGSALFVSGDERFLVTSNWRNTVYVYDLETGVKDPVFTTRTVSNVHYKAISPAGKLLAAKNTSGTIAVISMETGEELLRNPMAKSEGYPMAFTEDGKGILDLDWAGSTMYLDIAENKMTVLDESPRSERTYKGQVESLRYDRYSGKIYKFVMGSLGRKNGMVQASSFAPDQISYETLREAPYSLPEHLRGISCCKDRNYHLGEKGIVVSDKEYRDLEILPLPDEIACEGRLKCLYVSPCEKYVLFDFWNDISLLYDRETMELVRRFEYENVCDFTMVHEDKTFIVSTWEGAYIGGVEYE